MTKWPVLARQAHAAAWLQAWEDLGRAPRTVDAYARGLAEYLNSVSEKESIRRPRAGRTSRHSSAP